MKNPFRRTPRCCECGTTLNLLQWSTSVTHGWICEPCALLFHYFDYLVAPSPRV
jgi:hypothetical protein